MTQFLFVFLQMLVAALWLLVLARVLLSWVNPGFSGPIARFIFETTEPLLAPIRRVLPQSGMMDFSPFVLVLILAVLLDLVLMR